MKNQIADRGVIGLIAAVAALSGDGVIAGALFGVAFSDAEIGAKLEIATAGEFTLAKATGEAWAVGAPIYWDEAAGEATTDDDTAANKRIGLATAAALSAASVGAVLLTPGAA
jgi:predicted RecA/RadA family phage recombinase